MALRYDTPQVDRLAAEYVLGTLEYAARRRFERLMMDRADVRLAVWHWESHLNGLASGLEPQKPPHRVWNNIRKRTSAARSAEHTFLERWRKLWMAIPAAAAAALLVVVLLPAPGTERVAIFSDQNAGALWVISADLDKRKLQTESLLAQAAAIDKSYELWVLPTEGPPLSLGLLQVEPLAVEREISVQLASAIGSAGSLAISVEPAGGSTTGLPTGPVIYQASLVTI